MGRIKEAKSINYNVKFINLDEKEEKFLLNFLNKYQIKKVKISKTTKSISQYHKNLSVLKNIIQLLPYSAFLISENRDIIAVNESGSVLVNSNGDKCKCYQALFENFSPCPNCCLEQSIYSKSIISSDYIEKEQATANWLYVGNGLFILFFRRKKE